MADRLSPLAPLTAPRALGDIGPDGPGVTLSTRTDLSLWQVAAWPQSAAAVAQRLAGEAGAVHRIGPLKWWILDGGRPDFDAAEAVTVDLSHDQTPIRVAGPQAERCFSAWWRSTCARRRFRSAASRRRGGIT
jgi:sarcosine oxidase gamma subunit